MAAGVHGVFNQYFSAALSEKNEGAAQGQGPGRTLAAERSRRFN